MTTESILSEREQTHGNFSEGASLMIALQELCFAHMRDKEVPAEITAALQMICLKLSRIAVGNPIEPDHWQDIAGYATLAMSCAVAENVIHWPDLKMPDEG